jgi:hypothetical protein
MEWRRNGSSMDIRGFIQKDATAGSGTGIVSLQIPDGKMFDPSKSVFSGSWTLLGVDKGSNFISVGGSNSTISFRTNNSVILGQQWLANTAMEFGVSIPIAQWAGSGTVGLVQGYEEYASNSDVSATASVTASGFLQGFGNFGGFGGGWAVGTVWTRRIKFTQPVQWGRDSLSLGIRDTTTGIIYDDVTQRGYIQQYLLAATNEYGFVFKAVLGDQYAVDVLFVQGGRLASGTWGGSGSPFSDFAGNAQWFIKKTSAGKPGETLPLVRAEYTMSTTIVPTTLPTQVPLTTKVKDTHSCVSNNAFTFPFDGTFLIEAQTGASAAVNATSNVDLNAILYRSGTQIATYRIYAARAIAALSGCDGSGAITIEGKAGDVIKISIVCGSSTPNTTGNISSGRFAFTLMGR